MALVSAAMVSAIVTNNIREVRVQFLYVILPAFMERAILSMVLQYVCALHLLMELIAAFQLVPVTFFFNVTEEPIIRFQYVTCLPIAPFIPPESSKLWIIAPVVIGFVVVAGVVVAIFVVKRKQQFRIELQLDTLDVPKSTTKGETVNSVVNLDDSKSSFKEL